MTMVRFVSCCIVMLVTNQGKTQESVTLSETFPPGYQYRVSCRVEIKGHLALPPQKDAKAPTSLPLVGTSVIDYVERILPPLPDNRSERTIRVYRKMDFQRKVGDQPQELSLRPEVRRLVLLRPNQYEVPFSPEGPLLWNEIDLVRTDVFTPALVDLMPLEAVKMGDSWQAREKAMKELTDLERVDSSRLACTFETITTLVGKKMARIKLDGWVQGVGEDGPAKHQLEGYYLFDLESKHLSYLFVKGSHTLLDKEGKSKGVVEGTFVLTREPADNVKELSDEALRGIALEPNEENTQLLMDVPERGVRFLYPRRWRVSSIDDSRITLDEPKGSGLLITIEPAAKTPTGVQFLGEALTWLKGKKAHIHKQDSPRSIGGTSPMEHFALDVELDRQRIWLDYYVGRFGGGGATFAARLAGSDQASLRRDVERIARSFQFNKK